MSVTRSARFKRRLGLDPNVTVGGIKQNMDLCASCVRSAAMRGAIGLPHVARRVYSRGSPQFRLPHAPRIQCRPCADRHSHISRRIASASSALAGRSAARTKPRHDGGRRRAEFSIVSLELQHNKPKPVPSFRVSREGCSPPVHQNCPYYSCLTLGVHSTSIMFPESLRRQLGIARTVNLRVILCVYEKRSHSVQVQHG
jgi:hypothetical protein